MRETETSETKKRNIKEEILEAPSIPEVQTSLYFIIGVHRY